MRYHELQRNYDVRVTELKCKIQVMDLEGAQVHVRAYLKLWMLMGSLAYIHLAQHLNSASRTVWSKKNKL